MARVLCHANGDDAIGEGVGERWSLLQAEVGALAKTHESGEHRLHELVPRDGMPQPERLAALYARKVFVIGADRVPAVPVTVRRTLPFARQPPWCFQSDSCVASQSASAPPPRINLTFRRIEHK
jgi:hypothetical protein